MEKAGIPEKLIRLTRICVEGSKSRVRVKGKLSTSFEVKTGVKQGDCLSPLLFNLALEKVIKSGKDGNGPTNRQETYADDIVLIGKNKEELRDMMKVLVKEITEVGLEINTEKTKYLPISRCRNAGPRAIDMAGVALEKIDYLGGLLNERNIMEKEILTGIHAGNRCSFSMWKITSKLRIYKTIIQSVMLYGAELWTLTKIIENKLMAFENGILRQIFGPVKEGDEGRKRKNKELINLYQLPDIGAVIKGQRLRWYGHIMRRDGDLVKDVVERCLEEKRPCGRRRLRWLEAIKEDIRKADVLEEEWRDWALWKRLVGKEMDRLRSVMPL
ncbi:hypothetical protein PR048_017247, partial [Dryococelus australis]